MIVSEKVKNSLSNELKKKDNEDTTFEIRIYDSSTGSACYKQLTRLELMSVLEKLDSDNKLTFR